MQENRRLRGGRDLDALAWPDWHRRRHLQRPSTRRNRTSSSTALHAHFEGGHRPCRPVRFMRASAAWFAAAAALRSRWTSPHPAGRMVAGAAPERFPRPSAAPRGRMSPPSSPPTRWNSAPTSVATKEASGNAPGRRVLCPDEATRAARPLLVDAARHVIRNGLACSASPRRRGCSQRGARTGNSRRPQPHGVPSRPVAPKSRSLTSNEQRTTRNERRPRAANNEQRAHPDLPIAVITNNYQLTTIN